ncbi:MAG TPA: AAA family ATPase, partial [Beutenbergiaceae bacterium]|nr:AAA family ATPase [Beutenbergiaceae bacterium]
VVGPNGSGKSNVVDALAWVMGEQGAKSLRGGNMADVIFAGTSSRAPLGRAEVSLTIDNSDGVLPIDYTEVTISRTLFRNGGSEYAINGTPCRLLDIQELLSDTGMGREMHVIVGQGQLDSVLSATPEDRRAFIEEAAGVLKHRRRKEKALRKLDSMEANVARLKDLVAEIRRQLGPLARQAEVARKASVVQADVRDAKARLLADDLVQMLANLEAEKADEQALRTQRAQVEKEVNETRARLTELEQQAARQAPLVNEASEFWYRLSSVRERLRGTLTLAEERIRLLDAPDQAAASGPDPDELERQADQARSALQELEEEKSQAAATLEDLIAQRKQAEEHAAQAERGLSQLHQGIADHREGVAKLTGQVSAKRSRLEATEAEIERLRNTHTHALKRARAAEEEYVRREHDVVGAQTSEEELKAAHHKALTALDTHEKTVAELTEKHQGAHTALASYRARAEALELALTKKDANNLLHEEGHPGVVGPLTEHISVQGGYEDAIAAALGNWA